MTDFLVWIVGAAGFLLTAFIYGWIRRGKKVKEKNLQRKLQSIDTRREKQREAETQDDQSLINRLTDHSRRVPPGG